MVELEIPKKENGFTLLQVLIVIIIVGILAALGYINYTKIQESSFDKEAQSDLILINSAEQIYYTENNNAAYGQPPLNSNSGLNAFLNLSLPSVNSNWNYRISNVTPTAFTATATRTSNIVPVRVWTISGSTANPNPRPSCSGSCQ